MVLLLFPFSSDSISNSRVISPKCKDVQEINTKIHLLNPSNKVSLKRAHALLIYYKYFSVKNPRTLLGLSNQVSQVLLDPSDVSNLLFCRPDANINVNEIACSLLENEMRTLGAVYLTISHRSGIALFRSTDFLGGTNAPSLMRYQEMSEDDIGWKSVTNLLISLLLGSLRR